MKTVLAVTKALSDPNRLRMLSALRGGELCVCQLIDLVQLAPSTVSKHLSVLHQAGLVESRKAGRWVHYRLPRKYDAPVAGRMVKESFRALEQDAQIRADARRLKSLRTSDLEALCRNLLKKS